MLRSFCPLFCLLRLSGYPLESARRYESNDQEVLSTKAARILPSVAVQIRSLKRDIEHVSFVSVVAPNARTHGTVLDPVDRLRFNFCRFFHNFWICLVRLYELGRN